MNNPLQKSFEGLIVGLLLLGSAIADDRRYDFERKTLANGLTVISLEDHSCPIVAVQIWYAVGSKHEDPERQGFAHMFEHMMFRGTDRLGPEEHFTFIRRTGGDCNAFTSFDNTTYVNELPSNQLELALWLEAERMAFLRIDEESFHKERAVVEEERRMGSLNTPYGTVPEKLLPVLFTKHPYRWSPIGQIPHLRAAVIDELQVFWDKHYVPANATLVVVGDVKHADVHRLANQHFGWIPTMPRPADLGITEPPQTAPRQVTIPEKKGPIPIVGYMYRGVPEAHVDSLPLQMLMTILGGGESSRIYNDLVKERKVAQVAVAGAFALQDDGLCGAGAAIMPWSSKQAALDAVAEHVRRAGTDPVTPRELEKVRNQFLSNEVANSLTVASKASLLGSAQTIEGDAEVVNRRLGRIRSITAEDLQRVARTYLTKERETQAIIQPEIGGMIKSIFGGSKEDDVSEGAAPVVPPTGNRVAKRGGERASLVRPGSLAHDPPVADLLAAVQAPSVHEQKLDTGLRLVVVENHEVPFVTLTLGILNGSWTESKPGVAAMAAQMITKGSAHHSAAELAEELEFNAVSLGGSSAIDAAQINASCVSDKFDLAMKLLGEVVRTPTFPDSELEIMRQQVLLGLMIEAKTPEYLADSELRRRIYGSHPYSRTATGEPADVQTISAAELQSWWSTFVRPDSCVLYISGDVNPKSALDAAAAQFKDWNPVVAKPVVTLPEIPTPAPTHIYLINRPGSVQSQIRVGHLGMTRKNSDYFKGVVASQIFGGGFNSRLNKAIRIEKGLTYGARGGLQSRRFSGEMKISTFTKTPTTAESLQVILKEIDKIRSTKPEADELTIARSYLIGSFAGGRETPSDVANDLWLIDYADLPQDYLKRYLDGVKNTSDADIQAVATRYITPDKAVIVVVGEAEKIKADLEKIAPVTVMDPEAMNSTPNEDAKPPS